MSNHFFAATQKDLQKVLRGWVFPPPPLAKPITLQVKTPWGGETPYATRLDRSTLAPVAPDAVEKPRLPRSPGVQNTAVGLDELPDVFATLTGMPLSEAKNLVAVCGEIAGPSSQAVAVYRLPDSLVDALVAATPEDLERAASSLEVGTPEDLAEELDEIKELAKKARSNKRDLFLAYYLYD